MEQIIIKAVQDTLEKRESTHSITKEELDEVLKSRMNGVKIPQPMEILEEENVGK